MGMRISYSYEEKPLGTAGPIAMIDGLDETFMVTNGDVLTMLPFSDLLRFQKEQQAAATIAAHHRQVKTDFGVIQWNGAPAISGYIEKPANDYCVSMGVYIFDPRVVNYIPRGEYLDFPDLVRKLIESGERVVGYSFDGYWQGLGRPEDYERAMQDFE